MSFGEQFILRIVAALFIALVVFCFRFLVALLKKGVKSLTGSGKNGKAAKPASPVQPIAPPPVQPIAPVETADPDPFRTIPEPPIQPVTPIQPVQPIRPTEPLQPPINGQEAWASYNAGFRLVVLNGPLAGRVYELDCGSGSASYTMGRNTSCNIRFPSNTAGISGLHCKLTVQAHTGAKSAVLEDCGSTYGTFLANGQRVMPGQKCLVRSGEVFLLAGREGVACRLERA